MIRVFTDFNGRTPEGICWILKIEGTDLDSHVAALGLRAGDKILLFQDENDFEVTATLDFRFVKFLQREAWVATPDWSTYQKK